MSSPEQLSFVVTAGVAVVGIAVVLWIWIALSARDRRRRRRNYGRVISRARRPAVMLNAKVAR